MMIDIPVNGKEVRDAGPGLFEGVDSDGWKHLTNVRKIAGKISGKERPRGQSLLNVVTALLILLDAGVLYVSFAAQFRFIEMTRNQEIPSGIEAGMLDLALIIFSGLGIALSLKGKSSKAVRVLIIVFAAASAGMNYAAADGASWRSVVVYTSAPAVLAIVTDQVISVIRRYYLGKEETSAWSALGGAVVSSVKLGGLVLLYGLRTALAPKETVSGLRRLVLGAAPVPGKALESNVVPELEPMVLPELPPIPDEDWKSYGDQDEPVDDDTAIITGYLRASGRCAEQISPTVFCTQENPCAVHDHRMQCQNYGCPEKVPCPVHAIPEPEIPEAEIVRSLIGDGRCPVRGDFPNRTHCCNDLPCPDHQDEGDLPANNRPSFPTKKAGFLSLYRGHKEYGNRSAAAAVAEDLAHLANLQPGTGRTYIAEEMKKLESTVAKLALAITDPA
jgi:hypothetical protein